MSIDEVMFSLADVCRATGGVLRRESGAKSSVGLVTDSRRVRSGVSFVGLKGETFDGSLYGAQAVEQGASIVVLERSGLDAALRASGEASVIEVESGVRALGQLAALHRDRTDARIVAITGSNGKTTTKEMLAAVLREEGPTLSTIGNLNNEIGAPLTLLELESAHRFAVIELGMNHEGEIARLTSVVRPAVGVVTNVAAVHVEHFDDGIEGVSHAKGELFHGLALGGVAVANADDPRVLKRARAAARHTVTFGRAEGAFVRLLEVLSHDGGGLVVRVRLLGEERVWRLPVVGLHNALNACAAAAAACALGVGLSSIEQGLAKARPPGRRLRLSPIPETGAALLDDCYNANPASTIAALHTLAELAAHPLHRVAVVGDMRELGAQEQEGHRAVGRVAADVGLKLLVAFGDASRHVADEAIRTGLAAERVVCTNDPAEAAAAVRAVLQSDDIVLVKASRGTRLERVSDLLAPRAETH